MQEISMSIDNLTASYAESTMEKHSNKKVCKTCNGAKMVLSALGKIADCKDMNCSRVTPHWLICPDCKYCLLCNLLVADRALCPDKRHHRNVDERTNEDSPVMCECGVTQMYRVLEEHSIGRGSGQGQVWVTKAADRRQL